MSGILSGKFFSLRNSEISWHRDQERGLCSILKNRGRAWSLNWAQRLFSSSSHFLLKWHNICYILRREWNASSKEFFRFKYFLLKRCRSNVTYDFEKFSMRSKEHSQKGPFRIFLKSSLFLIRYSTL